MAMKTARTNAINDTQRKAYNGTLADKIRSVKGVNYEKADGTTRAKEATAIKAMLPLNSAVAGENADVEMRPEALDVMDDPALLKILQQFAEYISQIDDYSEYLTALKEELAYKGLDLTLIWAMLLAAEPNLRQLKIDMYIILMYLLLQGPLFSRNIARLEGSPLKSVIEALINKYKINDNVESRVGNSRGKNNFGDDRRTSMTASRIALLFPALVVNLFIAGYASPIVTYPGLPEAFCNPYVAAIIPQGYYTDYIGFSVALSDNINRKIPAYVARSKEEKISEQKGYIDAARANRKHITQIETERIHSKVMAKYNLPKDRFV